MDIAKAAANGDATIEKDGLKIFLEQRASEMLNTTTIDFVEAQGFVLTGMQQSSCGSSCSTC
jgi:Fe-S cluster assembly iron-binding protein IscA